jgi:diguanylate cyclase (GGDEF)-like protein/PAS domain S-box-containing protein
MTASGKPVRIGLLAPMTGVVSMYGPEIVAAARIACDEINEGGGVLGRPFEIIVRDDGSQPEQAVIAARALVEADGCEVLIGALLSNVRIAVASHVTEPENIPLLNFSFSEGSLFGPRYFHFAAIPNQQLEHLIPRMVDLAGPKMFFAGNNYEWPIGSIDACSDFLRQAGGERVGERYLPLGVDAASIGSLLDEVERSGADVFAPFFAGRDQIEVLRQCAERDLHRHMRIVTTHFDELMAAQLEPTARMGIFCCGTYFMSLDNPRNRACLARLDAASKGTHPATDVMLTHFGEGVWICVQGYAKAIRAAGSARTEDVLPALRRVEVDAPQGRVRMDPQLHHAWVNTWLARSRADGSFEILEAFGQVAPRIPARYRDAWSKSDAIVPAAGAPAAEPAGGDVAQSVLDRADAALVLADPDGTITLANPAAHRLFGYFAGELVGTSVHLLVPPNLRAFHAAAVAGFAEGTHASRLMGDRAELTGYRKDGSTIAVEATIARFERDGRTHLLATLRDISARRQARDEMRWNATHDSMTGLANRSLALERLRSAIGRAERNRQHVAVLLVDLDEFKPINDVHGHAVGDQVLVDVANRLLECARPGDIVARLAGDEFVVLCEQLQDPIHIGALADRIVESLRRPLQIGPHLLRVSASVGVATSADHDNAEQLLANADTAMYAAKQQGRDGWRMFSADLQHAAERRVAIIQGLHAAVSSDALSLRFQPMIDLDTDSVVGAEALLRWRTATGEAVGPAEFIPLAETSGSIHAIGLWAFRAACQASARWKLRWGAAAPAVSINLSPRQLEDGDLPERFATILAATGCDPRCITMEVTESSAIAESETPQEVLRQLVATGFRLAVDDFGTGYASLQQLLRLPVHEVKVDRGFVAGMTETGHHRALVVGVMGLANALGLRVVAEGVETEAQCAALRAIGARHAQGFLLGMPEDEAAFVQRVDARVAAHGDVLA